MPTRQERRLREVYGDRAYARVANLSRRKEESSKKYKKGYEVRIRCNSKAEVNRLERALANLGFTPGAPFAKGPSRIVPVYGRDQVRDLALILGIDLGVDL